MCAAVLRRLRQLSGSADSAYDKSRLVISKCSAFLSPRILTGWAPISNQLLSQAVGPYHHASSPSRSFSSSSVQGRMKAVRVIKKVGRFNEECKECFTVEDVPMPDPGPKEVLVKMVRAQINPSDTSFCKDQYGQKLELPSPVGFEGCGVVVYSGAEAGLPVGAPVSLRGFGTWAEYCATSADQCMLLTDDTSWENAAGGLVNPLTAYNMVREARMRGATSMVCTAAAGGLGRQLIRYGAHEGVGVVAVVRRPEQVAACLQAGALAALDSSDPLFPTRLQEVCEEHRCTLCFDAVAGAQAGQILSALAPGGHVLVYGGLSGKPVGDVQWSHLIFQRKGIEGFWMTGRLAEQLESDAGRAQAKADMHVLSGLLEGPLSTDVSRIFPMEDVGEALVYMRENMSAGKVQLAMTDDKWFEA